MTCGSRCLPASRPTCRRLPAWSNHHNLFPRAISASAVFWLGERPAVPIQSCWLLCPDPLAGSRPVSPKAFSFPAPKTRVASSGTSSAITCQAALVVVAAGEVRCLHKRPRQIRVAAFAVVLAFFLLVALADAFHAAAVAGE